MGVETGGEGWSQESKMFGGKWHVDLISHLYTNVAFCVVWGIFTILALG
jgi:hypothetical protein